MNTPNSQLNINFSREYSVFSLLKSYLDLYFDVLHAATNNRHADGNDITLVNLEPIALFSNIRLTTSSGKLLEDISHANIVSLTYKLITTAIDTDDLSIGFYRDPGKRQQQLTNNKTQKGTVRLRIMLKDIFGFLEHQEKSTYVLGFKNDVNKK